MQVGFQREVQLEIDLIQRGLHACLVDQGPQPLVLLGGEHDRGRVTPGREPRERPRLANQRLAREPAEVDRVAGSFGGRERQPPPGAEIVERRDGGQHEPARELTALGFGRGEHRRLVQQGARVDELPARLEIQHGRSGGHVVKERRPGRVQVRGIELDARESRAHAQSHQLVLPLRTHVTPQPVERNGPPETVDRFRAALGPDQELAAGADGHLRDGHHRALVLRIEQAERFDAFSRPLGTHRRICRGRKNVEDAAAQRELPSFLDQGLACVAQLDQPPGHRHGVRSCPRPQLHGALEEVPPGDRLARDRPPRRDHHDRFATGQRGKRLETAVHRLVEGRWAVQKRNPDLGEHMGGWISGEPDAKLVGEAIGPGDEDDHGNAALRDRARDGARHDWPGRPRQPRHVEPT